MNLRKMEQQAAAREAQRERLEDLEEFKRLVEEADVLKQKYPDDTEFSYMNRKSFKDKLHEDVERVASHHRNVFPSMRPITFGGDSSEDDVEERRRLPHLDLNVTRTIIPPIDGEATERLRRAIFGNPEDSSPTYPPGVSGVYTDTNDDQTDDDDTESSGFRSDDWSTWG